MDRVQVLHPVFVGRKLLVADRAFVSLVRAVDFCRMRVKTCVGWQVFPATLAGEVPPFVRARMVQHPLHGHERFAARLANEVLVVIVHVLVEAEEHFVTLSADLAAVLVSDQLVRQYGLSVRFVQNFSVVV